MSSVETAMALHPGAKAALLARFADAGYRRVETPILSPASIFLDFSGEAIRSALFLTGDRAGTELCLRPEYTIPVCRDYLASGRAGQQASFSYCGPVFRSRAGTTGESLQAGLENFGRTDRAAADAEILVLALEAAAEAGARDLSVSMGDAGLLSGLFDALHLPPSWQRRLRRGLDKGQPLAAILTEAPRLAGDHSGVLAALNGTDQQGARDLVEDLLSIAGIASVGGRSAAEIAERFLAQVASRQGPGFAAEQRQVLDAFLSVVGSPDDASVQLRKLASDAGLGLSQALDDFDERTNFIAAHGVAVDGLVYKAAFGRNLDYYTGFIFEARHPGSDELGSAEPRAGKAGAEDGRDAVVIGGGRYDRLAQSLGSLDPIPAVGASIWVERLARPEGAVA